MTPPTIPYSPDSERAVLGAMMLSPEAIDVATDIVHEDDFHLERHRFIFAAIVSISERSSYVDALTVKEELDSRRVLDRIGGYDYLSDILGTTVSAAGARHYAEIVKEKSTRRRIIAAGHEIVRVGHEAKEPQDDAERTLFSVLTDEAGEIQPISHMTAEFTKEFSARVAAGGVITGVKTGYRYLDSLLNGLPRKALIVLGARPGIGKTSLALNISDNACVQDLGTAIFSPEMSGQELITKIVSTRTGINYHRIQRGSVRGKEEGDLVTSTAREVGKLKLVIDDTSAITVGKIRARVRRIARRKDFNLSLVVVDYLQHMDTSGDGENMNYKIGEIVKGLKSLAKEMNVAVLLLSQFRRPKQGDEKKWPGLMDFRDSGAIESEADIAIILHRPVDQDSEASEEDKRDARLKIAKNRHGESNRVVRMNWIYERGKFEEVE